jgi:hypothetical protein
MKNLESTICPDCSGDCDAVLEGLREALGLKVKCSMCGAEDSEQVKIRLISGEPFCYHCAEECFS